MSPSLMSYPWGHIALSQFKQDFSADYKESYWSTVRSMRERVAGAEYVSYLTKFWKNYGKAGLIIHSSLYVTTISSCYIGISHFGGGEQALQYLKMIPWEYWQTTVSGWSPNASSLAMSILIAEATDIFRAPITILLARAYKKRRDARLAATAATTSSPPSNTNNSSPPTQR
jgi:hypothetical protein